MSKRRLVITAVVIEGCTHADVAAQYGLSRSWVTRLVGRYRSEGDAAFEPRSRRPHTSPARLADVVNKQIVNLRVDLTTRGLDAGPHTNQWHLANQGHTVSVSTIHRRLVTAGLITPEPKKRPKSSYIRFEAELPNEMWQSDFTHQRLTTGADTEIITWLDDHSRYTLSVTAHHRVTGDIVVDTFDQCGLDQGFPASVLTDNGMVYTTRFAGFRGGRNALETRLAELEIQQKNSAPNHPTTCGKVEHFHQTLKKWLTAQQPQPASIGRPLKETAVIMLIDDLDIRVINTTTGELLRHLTLNPKRGYQPRFKT